MEIVHLRRVWFGARVYNDTETHRHFHTVRFANRPNIDAQIWLSIFSPGATYANGAVTALGLAAAGIQSYSFINDNGGIETKDLSEWISNVSIKRVVDLTFGFHIRLAWAKAEGMIYYWE